MTYFTKIALSTALALGISSFNTLAKDAHAPQPSFSTTKLTDTLYMLSGKDGFTGGNVALTVGEDGVAMIDNGVSSVLDILKAQIATITKQPIDYMINTHIHGDHIGNNHAFGDTGALIVSHENLRASLIKKDASEGKTSKRTSLPILTFNDRMTIQINGDAAKINHFDQAHTDGDAVVFFEKDNVLHTGDILFNGLFPYIDSDNGGTLDGVIRALEGIITMINDKTTIIPGHGPLASKTDVVNALTMIKDCRALVKAMVDAGNSDADILKANPLAKYESYSWGFINTEKMTQQVLTALR